MQYRLNIRVSRETKDALDAIKHQGQSYDGVIRELLTLWHRIEDHKIAQRREETKGGNK